MAQAIQTNDYIIDENSEQIEQPEGLKINLKPHQLALINKMLHLEDRCQYKLKTIIKWFYITAYTITADDASSQCAIH